MSQQPQTAPAPPPAAQVLQMASGYFLSRSIGVAAKLGIADLLSQGPRATGDLAVATNTNPDALYRVLRALACTGVFQETEHGAFANTPLSETLRADVPGSIRNMVLFLCDEMHWKVYAQFDYSVETGKAAFDHVYGMPPFRWLQQDPKAAQAFDAAMASHSSMDAEAVAGAAEFASGDIVADIGGGNGKLLATILARHPGTRGILYDLPHAVGHARSAGLAPADRCEFIGGDFFESVCGGANIYLMKHILHDWDDEKSVQILRNIRTAIPAGGRVWVIELMLPPGNEPGFAKFLDLEMLLITGGRERTPDEYGALFAKSGFRMTKVRPTRSPLAIFEAEPV